MFRDPRDIQNLWGIAAAHEFRGLGWVCWEIFKFVDAFYTIGLKGWLEDLKSSNWYLACCSVYVTGRGIVGGTRV